MGTSGSHVATIGVFDGVHLGHRFLLNKVCEVAAERGMSSLAVTFEPTPAEVFAQRVADVPADGDPDSQGRLLSLLTLDERRERLLCTGIDKVEVLPFSRELAAMTASQFMTFLMERYGVRVLVMGYDHRFGCEQRRDTAFYDAAAARVGMEIVHATAYAGAKEGCLESSVSSTCIRKALLHGDAKAAEAALGYPYFMAGKVIDGDGRGRTLGFPTANLAIDERKLVPATGVYAVKVEIGNPRHSFWGMMNIGLCPTFGGRTERRIEVHILDFDADIYGQTLRVSLLHRLRNEQRFTSVEALVTQLQTDAKQVRDYIQKIQE